MITTDKQTNNTEDFLVKSYVQDILRQKSKIQALNHCQNEIELTHSDSWKEFMIKVKSNIIIYNESINS